MLTRFILTASTLFIVGVSSMYYDLDSVSECSLDAGDYTVHNLQTVNVYGGRGSSYSTTSPNKICKISLHADDSYSYSSRILDVDVNTAIFDTHFIELYLYDGSNQYSYSTKYTVSKFYNFKPTFKTTQPYVYIVLDKTLCSTQSCMEGLDVNIKVSMERAKPYGYGLTTESIIGIVIGTLLVLGLLIGAPICICYCDGDPSGGRRSGENLRVPTTTPGVVNSNYTSAMVYTSTTGYPTQQYGIQGQNIPLNNQPQPRCEQGQFQTMAPQIYIVQPTADGGPPFLT